MVPVSKPQITFKSIIQKIIPHKIVTNSAQSTQFLMAPNPTPVVSPYPQQVIVQRPPSIKPQTQQLVMVQQPNMMAQAAPTPVQQMVMHQQPQQVQHVMMKAPQPTQQIFMQSQQVPVIVGSNQLHQQSKGFIQVANSNPVSARSVVVQANSFQPQQYQTITMPVSYRQQ